MKNIILTLCFLIFSVYVSAQDISGSWTWQYGNGKHITEIELSFSPSDNNIIQGNYCSVFYEGGKIDCVENESSFCLTLTQVVLNIYEGTFQSFSHNGSGTIRLTYNPFDEELNLEILSSQGVYYLPREAIFER